MSKTNKIAVKGIDVSFIKNKQEDFICITDIAKGLDNFREENL